MRSLFLLIALYTLKGGQAVPSGDIPDGESCEFVQSGTTTGQMTAGNYITLTIGGYDEVTLNSVTLKMHSNKDTGAGSLKMTVGGTSVWTIDDAAFSSSSWAGRYSKDFVNVTHSLGGVTVPKNASITLYIRASVNSLYLQSVELNYTAPAPKSYTVSFHTHIPLQVNPITEPQPYAGVILPDVPLEDPEWLFIGWNPTHLLEDDMPPLVYKAGELFYPTSDCTLHAIYMEQHAHQPWLPTDDLTMEDYLIALYEPSNGSLWYANGEVVNGMLPTAFLSLPANDGWVALPASACTYDAVFSLSITNDTVTIVHKATGTKVMLGLGGKFTQGSFLAKDFVIAPMDSEADEMPHFVISGIYGDETYYFSYNVSIESVVFFCPTNKADMRHDLLLFAVSDADSYLPRYTSYPYGGVGVTQPCIDNLPAYRMQIGTYVLTIKNGKKFLQINE